MDTFSSALSVVKTAYEVIEFFESVTSAGEDCRQLVRELYTATCMVNNLRTLAAENAEKLGQLNSLLVPNGGLDQFRHTVDEISSRILQSKGIKEAYKRVKFVLRHQTMQELLESIQRQQVPFVVCLGAENTKLLLKLVAEVSVLSSDMQHLTAQTSSNGDPSQGNIPSEIKHPFRVPFSQDTHSLVVRDAYQNIIESKFKNCARLTLYGLGGSGKSRLAIEFAYRHKDSCPVFWVYAGSDAAFRDSYSKVAQEVPPDFRRHFHEDQANESNDQRRDVISYKVKLATAWLESPKSGDWTMILDNCDNQNIVHGEGNEPSILHQLPVPSRGKILATSRRKDMALSISGSENAVVYVEAFLPEQAVMCFKQLLPNDNAADDEILSLARELSFLPLAIRQAVAYISKQSASIEEYSRHLKSSETSKLGLLEQDFQDTMRADDVPNAVLLTWLVSFEQMLLQNEESAKMLCFMATLDRSKIQDRILKEVWKDPLAFRANIGLVLAFSFIGVIGPRRNAYTMHRLIQLSTLTWMKRRGEKERFDRMALSSILKLFEHAVATIAWADCQLLLPHARLLLASKFENSELAVDKAKLMELVETFENPPLWQLSSQHSSETYRRLLAMEDLIDVSSILDSHSRFQEWLRGSQRLLFLRGRTSCGKTVACSFIIQVLQSRLDASGSRPIVAYFFFSLAMGRKVDIVKALALDIISQICQQLDVANVPERIWTLLSNPDERRSRKYLMDTIIDLCRDTNQRTFVILDGLNECSGEFVPEIIEQIIPALMKGTCNVSILVSSRPWAVMVGLETELNAAIMEWDDLNEIAALDDYILTRLQRSQLSPERMALVHQRLRKKSEGSFLWTRYAMQTMEKGNEPDRFLELLETIPRNWDGGAQFGLGNIRPAYRKQVSVLLLWAAFAFRPLTAHELSDVFDIQGQDCSPSSIVEIVKMTEGVLVTHDVNSSDSRSVAHVIQPLHAAVREQLSSPLVVDFHIPHPEEAHEEMLDVCLQILVERGGSQSPDLKQHPFLQYAAEFWPKHLEELRGYLSHGLLFTKTSGYLRKLFDAAAPAAFLCWLRLSDPAEPELGVQLTKNLNDFRPIQFYLDMFNLQKLVMGSQRNSVEEEPQHDTSEEYRDEATQEHQDDTSGSGSNARYRILCCRPH